MSHAGVLGFLEVILAHTATHTFDDDVFERSRRDSVESNDSLWDDLGVAVLGPVLRLCRVVASTSHPDAHGQVDNPACYTKSRVIGKR